MHVCIHLRVSFGRRHFSSPCLTLRAYLPIITPMKTWLIIDGYNLIFQLPHGLPNLPPDLAGKRQYLLRMLDETAGVLAGRVTVVFDGRAAHASETVEAQHVDIRFSPSDKTADTVIEQMVYSAEHPEDICVVTSDRAENETIRATGAEAMSCAVFFDYWNQARNNLGWLVNRRATLTPGFTLGDLFPDEKG